MKFVKIATGDAETCGGSALFFATSFTSFKKHILTI
jgi:hypothetical protein